MGVNVLWKCLRALAHTSNTEVSRTAVHFSHKRNLEQELIGRRKPGHIHVVLCPRLATVDKGLGFRV
jgi:hypothetical protein